MDRASSLLTRTDNRMDHRRATHTRNQATRSGLETRLRNYKAGGESVNSKKIAGCIVRGRSLQIAPGPSAPVPGPSALKKASAPSGSGRLQVAGFTTPADCGKPRK